jgi:hypothetical protein
MIRGASVLLVALVTTAACGARTPLLVPLQDGGLAHDAGVAVDGSCVGQEIPFVTKAPTLYFVLDSSGSMADESKWSMVRDAVANLMIELGSRARFGAATFPAHGSADGACAPGAEVLAPQPGDSRGSLAKSFLSATAFMASGGTPTAPTLDALAPELEGLAGSIFAILVTDGGANCNPSLTCDASECTDDVGGSSTCDPGNCLDVARTVQAVAALKAHGVATFVMGIPGSDPFAALLDQLAQAGGTARGSEPQYYAVASADTQALASVLAQVAAEVTATCTFTLAAAPSDLAEVRVTVGGEPVPQGGPDGWQIAGTTLTFEGASCAELETGRAVSVRVIEGCPP